jgi:RNAse (barnase) inhibitor barstar
MTYRLRAQWRDAIIYGQWEEADRLWKLLMTEWLTPRSIDWAELLDRRMAVLERSAQRRAIDDDEWDQQHEGVNS